MKQASWLASCCLTAFAFLAASAQADVIDNHVRVTSTYTGYTDGRLPGYDVSYGLQLGTSDWPFPYVDVHVDKANGQSSFARLAASRSYLTYVHHVDVFVVTPGAEISNRTLASGDFQFIFGAYDYGNRPDRQMEALVSPGGNDPDIYLGFSYKSAQAADESRSFGWMHLRYTQQAGLTMVSSAMTRTDAGIYALSRETIPSVSEPGVPALALVGIAGLFACRLRQRKA